MFRPYTGGDPADMIVLDRSDPSGEIIHGSDNYEFQILEGGESASSVGTAKTETANPRRRRAVRVGACTEALHAIVCNGFGIFILLFVYILCGAALFLSLEGGSGDFPHSKISSSNGGAMSLGVQGESVHVLRQQTVEKLWKITEELNILYKENWTTLANREIIKFQEELMKTGRDYGKRSFHGSHKGMKDEEDDDFGEGSEAGTKDQPWTFASAFLYSLSLITTVGSTQRSPKSFLGKLAAIFLVICGFPLLLIYLNVVGSGLARSLRRMYDRILKCCHCRRESSSREEDLSASEVSITRSNASLAQATCTNCTEGESARGQGVVVPLGIATIAIVALYVLFGAIVFAWTEKTWTLFDGIFFSFAILCTIGLYGGSHIDNEPIFVVLCAFYLLVGLALISTVYHVSFPQKFLCRGPWSPPEDR